MSIATERAILKDLNAAEAKVIELEACNDALTSGLFAVLTNLSLIGEANVYQDPLITLLINETREWVSETLKEAGR